MASALGKRKADLNSSPSGAKEYLEPYIQFKIALGQAFFFELGFNPTLVRLTPHERGGIVERHARFNPTLVRLTRC